MRPAAPLASLVALVSFALGCAAPAASAPKAAAPAPGDKPAGGAVEVPAMVVSRSFIPTVTVPAARARS